MWRFSSDRDGSKEPFLVENPPLPYLDRMCEVGFVWPTRHRNRTNLGVFMLKACAGRIISNKSEKFPQNQKSIRASGHRKS
jgi:hypothetical protein